MSQATTWSVPLVGPATPTLLTQRIDDSLDALLSGHSGSARPSYAVAGTVWEDTSVAGTVSVKFYDGTDDILLCTVNTSTNVVSFPAATVGLQNAGGFRWLFDATALTANRTLKMPDADLDLGNVGIKADAVVALSGTSQDITGIPSGVRRLTIVLDEVTVSAAAQLYIQLGTSGGIVTSGYLASNGAVSSVGANAGTSTVAIPVAYTATAAVGPYRGHVTLTRVGSTNRWIASVVVQYASGLLALAAAGVTLPGALDRIRLTTAAGTATLGGNIELLREMDV